MGTGIVIPSGVPSLYSFTHPQKIRQKNQKKSLKLAAQIVFFNIAISESGDI